VPVLKKLTLLSLPFAALAFLAAPAAFAETLIYVTSSNIGTVDSSSPGVDNTSGNNGSLSYSLPSGFYTVGAKVSSDNATLYLLASDGGVCQLFSVNTTGNSSGQASLTEVNGSYGCSTATGNGDFGFLNGSGGSSGLDEYLVANGADVLEVPVGGGTPASIEIGNPNGGVGNIQGVVSVGTSPNDIPYGVDASTKELVQLNLGTGGETDINALPFTFSGSTSLDYSTASGNFYLYTNGALYSDSITYGVDSSSLGNLPSGTLAVTVAGNVGVTNSNGGAFAPALLLPLGALALLRRRRARSA
jgi:hypothetical protein